MHPPNIAHVQQYVGIIKDVLTGIAALVAAVAAYRGFNAWRVQLVGNSSYDVGRQVLRAVSKLRNAVEAYRHSATLNYELEGRRDEEDKYQALFRFRGRPVIEALADLDVALVEAEAIWGSTSRAVIDPLSRKVMGLILNANLLSEVPQDDPTWRNIHQAVLGDFGDEFGAEYTRLEAEIVRYAQSRMGIANMYDKR